MIEPRGLEENELEELPGTTVQIIAVGSDGFVIRTPDSRLIVVSLCMACGSHLAYYEIDEDMIVTTSGDPDIVAS